MSIVRKETSPTTSHPTCNATIPTARSTLKGTLDGVPYDFFCMKDVDYTMKLMATYGSPLPKPDAPDKHRMKISNNGVRETLTFKYTEPFQNHYLYRHAIDDHNNLRHSDISLEETWVTHRWENRVFAFILSITEVNRYFVWQCGNKVPVKFIQFRRQLAKALIYNEHMQSEEDECTPRRSKQQQMTSIDEHKKLSAPHHVRAYTSNGWELGARDRYQKYTCRSPAWLQKTCSNLLFLCNRPLDV